MARNSRLIQVVGMVACGVRAKSGLMGVLWWDGMVEPRVWEMGSAGPEHLHSNAEQIAFSKINEISH